jgi:transglutaminase-like putative cysteine protease
MTQADMAKPMRYRVRHVTTYDYSLAMRQAHHTAHLKPRELGHQRVSDYRIAITPKPAVLDEHMDYYGNPTTYFAIQERHDELSLETSMEVEVAPRPAIDLELSESWESLRDRVALGTDQGARFASEFAYPSALVPYLPELAEYAAPSFAPGRPIGAASLDLTRRIYDEFSFDPAATTISTPLLEVLKERRGVCQDFAHLQIGCLRALGLPARYVSGYLRTVPPPGRKRLVGADASHAWLAVWCGEQWLDLDPTNGLIGSTDFITLAWGRDYGDVSPVSGVMLGHGQQILIVEVDVEPIE